MSINIGGAVKNVLSTVRKALTGEKQRMVIVDMETGDDKVLLDVVFEYGKDGAAQTSDHPIEGSSTVSAKVITDHVAQEPDTFSLSCLLTDSDFLIEELLNRDKYFDTKAKDRLDQLWKWKEAGAMLTLLTYDDQEDSLVIESISVKRSADFGNGVGLDLSLKRVTVAASLTGITAAGMLGGGSEALPSEEVEE